MASDDDKPPDIEIIHPIAVYGEKSRFSKENQPKHDRKKAWSIKRSIRRMAGAKVKIVYDKEGKLKLEDLTVEKIAEMLGAGDRQLTMAELVAARKFRDALGGNTKAQQELQDAIDGKLVNKTLEAKVTLEELLTGDYKDEADDTEQED